MRRDTCACGGTIEVPNGELVRFHVRQHVQTERHRLWSAAQEADLTLSLIEVPIRPLHWTRRAA